MLDVFLEKEGFCLGGFLSEVASIEEGDATVLSFDE